MISPVIDLTPLVLGGLLAWAGAGKAFSRSTASQAADSALMHLLHDVRRTTVVLRLVGALELVVAAGLLVRPTWVAPAAGASLLGIGFVCYLAYARSVAPESPCGCAGDAHGVITWRAFARAGLVAIAGVAAGTAGGPWWTVVAGRPLTAVVIIAVGVVGLAALSSDLDHHWLPPLRRARLRLLGHPLDGTGGPVPVAATVDLLERSLAWATATPLVRSGLLDHWDADGWRILRYSGLQEGPQGPVPVSVLFALDARATTDTTTEPVVRVTVIDEDRQEVTATPELDATANA
ncbi:MAG: MauE/DoxX family redox-associated membrane protein [Mycobacteriales bacterium]